MVKGSGGDGCRLLRLRLVSPSKAPPFAPSGLVVIPDALLLCLLKPIDT